MKQTVESIPMIMPVPSIMKDWRLARAYVIPQPYISIFPVDQALKKGTLFPNLYMPYKKEKKKREGNE